MFPRGSGNVSGEKGISNAITFPRSTLAMFPVVGLCSIGFSVVGFADDFFAQLVDKAERQTDLVL